VPPSPGRGLLVYQHLFFLLPEDPLHLFHIPGLGSVIIVFGGASSSEPAHLQHEEPGAQGCTVEIDDWMVFKSIKLFAIFCKLVIM